MLTESEVTPKPPPRRKPQSNPLLRAALILTTVVVVIPVLVPFVMVAVIGERFGASMQPRYPNANDRVHRAEAMRRFVLPKDSSITPMQAGRAFAALHAEDQRRSPFAYVDVPRVDAFWRDEQLAPELFVKARPAPRRGLPDPSRILGLVSGGFSEEEREFLDRVATAPVWRVVDSVTRAPAVDLLGGRFRLPYPDSAHVFEMPLIRFAATRDLAMASQVRAAHHLARQQRDSAEHALRSIVSLGFVLIDDGTTSVEATLGAILVGLGRTALEEFYTLTKNPEATALKVHDEVKSNQVARAVRPSARTAVASRAAMIALVRDSTTRRGIRFEMLPMLAATPCTNVRELAFGVGNDVEEAFAVARTQLPRHPSESAFIDLASRALDGGFPSMGRPETVLPHVLAGAASIASSILRNPRLKGCVTIMGFGSSMG